MSKVLVIGGAGYVGSATSAWLIDQGHDVWILDDLSTGHEELAMGGHFVEGQVGNREILRNLLGHEHFDCVMHFAAKSLVSESVRRPAEYFENNVVQTRELLNVMMETGTRRFIFSSTCSIFGDPGDKAINENLEKRPTNPYGETKLQVEKMMEQFAQERGLQAIALRYFNAAGAEAKLRVSEWHDPETHLIPAVLRAALEGGTVQIYGTDYPTPDGTCIRDYVHVSDLAHTHGAAMDRLLKLEESSGIFEAFNLGSENGFSVREVIHACERAVGHTLSVTERGRRPADPPRLVADSSLAKEALGFKINHSLDTIVESALEWEKKRRALITTSRKAIFLDRDGTINQDPGYIADPDLIKVYDGVARGLAKLKEAGYLLIVISNQSGVARGLIPEGALDRVHARLNDILTATGAAPDYYELCLHRPEDLCECRKPKPKLIFNAAMKLGIDISESYMIGDKPSDIGTGKNAGCKGVVLVRTGNGAETEKTLKPGEVNFVADTLELAADWILRQ